MFSKGKSKAESEASKADVRKQVPSIISASLRIVGNLVSAGDVQIDGIVDGDVKSRKLTISHGAAVNGAIEADSVFIQGEVNGQITAENVVLGASARVVGDVVHSNLMVESGAFLEGQVSHLPTVMVVEDQPVDAPSDVETATQSDSGAANESDAAHGDSERKVPEASAA